MKVSVLNEEGQEVSQTEILSGWDHRRIVPELLHQAVVAAAANARLPIAHTKTRGEVRGGGRKPWRQKGTGRARHGSIRSPLWRGGGTTFGPRQEREYAQRLPAKMRRAALTHALVAKGRAGELALVEMRLGVGKTKELARVLTNLRPTGSILLSVPVKDIAAIARAGANLSRVRVVPAEHLSAADVLAAQHLLITPAAWQIVESRLSAS